MGRDLLKLKVYELADHLALDIYRFSTQAPVEERFGWALQLRQAASATPLAIVEACGQGTPQAFLEGLGAAQLAAAKMQYLLSVARRLGQVSGPTCALLEDRCLQLVRSLHSLQKAEQTRLEAPNPRKRLSHRILRGRRAHRSILSGAR
jgi:four helix bundle protein